MKATYERIRDTIRPVLLDNGFIEIEEEYHPQAFGSCYITFKDGKERIRLTWDGKEQWFVLESTPESSMTFQSGWADILLQFFKLGEDGPEVVDEIAEDFRKALLDHLGKQPSHIKAK